MFFKSGCGAQVTAGELSQMSLRRGLAMSAAEAMMPDSCHDSFVPRHGTEVHRL